MRVISDIIYSDKDSSSQKLDIYLPECNEFPVYVYFHGGGLESCDKTDKDSQTLAKELTSNNIALVSANYRMYPSAKYPEFIMDAAQAVAWVHENIGNYGNCNGIYVGGSSAGGYMSMMLCFDKSYLSPYGISPTEIKGFVHDAGQPTVHFNVLREHNTDSKRVIIDERAPLYYVGIEENLPKMLFFVAENDIPGRYEQTMLIINALGQFGYDDSKIKLHVMEGSHCNYIFADPTEDGTPYCNTIIDFIKNQ